MNYLELFFIHDTVRSTDNMMETGSYLDDRKLGSAGKFGDVRKERRNLYPSWFPLVDE